MQRVPQPQIQVVIPVKTTSWYLESTSIAMPILSSKSEVESASHCPVQAIAFALCLLCLSSVYFPLIEFPYYYRLTFLEITFPTITFAVETFFRSTLFSRCGERQISQDGVFRLPCPTFCK